MRGFQGIVYLYFVSMNERDKWFQELSKFSVLGNLAEKYIQKKHLGKGTFARVTVGESVVNHKEYAIKAINKHKISLKKNSLVFMKLDSS